MGAREILIALRARGAEIRVHDDGRLEVSPRDALDNELRNSIRHCKNELLQHLGHSSIGGDERDSNNSISDSGEQSVAVLVRSRRFDCEIWIAVDAASAEKIAIEEARRQEPRPILLAEEVDLLHKKSTRIGLTILEVCRLFPRTRILQ